MSGTGARTVEKSGRIGSTGAEKARAVRLSEPDHPRLVFPDMALTSEETQHGKDKKAVTWGQVRLPGQDDDKPHLDKPPEDIW
jgi:hypothetical protein